MIPERPSYFGSFPDISPDPILGLAKLLEADPRPEKINAGIGVFVDEKGETFIPSAVRQARERTTLEPADYLAPSGKEEWLGDRQFLEGTVKLVFREQAEEILKNRQVAAAGTPGGTGAVALFAEAVKQTDSESCFLIGWPTWPNHLQILERRELAYQTYEHLKDNRYNFKEQRQVIEKSPANAVVLFHGGKSHNPTGVNPTSEEEWRTLAKTIQGRRVFFDTPYAGFVDGLAEDTQAIRLFQEEGIPLAVAFSYSKNGGLYKQRVGALLVLAQTSNEALKIQRLLNSCARTSYSSPPAEGEHLIAQILSDSGLRHQWEEDLAAAAKDLRTRREMLASQLPEFAFVKEQFGLFSLLPLELQVIDRLQKEYGIYMSHSGRINIGGIPSKDIPRFASAIKKVL